MIALALLIFLLIAIGLVIKMIEILSVNEFFIYWIVLNVINQNNKDTLFRFPFENKRIG